MEHLHLYRSIWKGILLKPTIRKIFGNLSYKMSWEKDSDCHKLHFSLISTTNFSWPKLNWTNLNQAESNLWCIFNTLTKDIFRYLVWSNPTLFSCVIFLHNLYIFPNFISCSKKYMEPIRAENHFWSPSLEFSSRHLVLSVKKRGKNSPSSQLCCISPLGSGQSEFSAVITASLLWIFPWAAQTCWQWGWPMDAWPSTTCGAGRTRRCWTAGQPGPPSSEQASLAEGHQRTATASPLQEFKEFFSGIAAFYPQL